MARIPTIWDFSGWPKTWRRVCEECCPFLEIRHLHIPPAPGAPAIPLRGIVTLQGRAPDAPTYDWKEAFNRRGRISGFFGGAKRHFIADDFRARQLARRAVNSTGKKLDLAGKTREVFQEVKHGSLRAQIAYAIGELEHGAIKRLVEEVSVGSEEQARGVEQVAKARTDGNKSPRRLPRMPNRAPRRAKN